MLPCEGKSQDIKAMVVLFIVTLMATLVNARATGMDALLRDVIGWTFVFSDGVTRNIERIGFNVQVTSFYNRTDKPRGITWYDRLKYCDNQNVECRYENSKSTTTMGKSGND